MQSFGRNGCLQAVSKTGRSPLLLTRVHRVHVQHYITTASNTALKSTSRPILICCEPGWSTFHHDQRRHVNTAVVKYSEEANPPAATRPPNFSKPDRGSKSFAAHLWDQSKAYGSFYKAGVKAIFANRKQAQEVRAQLVAKHGQMNERAVSRLENMAVLIGMQPTPITRSQYQLLRRNEYDMVRVPLFGVLIVVLGEWLVLILPLMPYIQPLTCRLPGVLKGMRSKVEARRRDVFRMGTKPPDAISLLRGIPTKDKRATAASHPEFWKNLAQALTQEELYHLSATLNLHSRLWELIGVGKNVTGLLGSVLRGRVADRLCYLVQDDILLQKAGSPSALLADETTMACEERGIDVVGKDESEMKSQLKRWAQKQQKDSFSGKALLEMLYKRPNAWG